MTDLSPRKVTSIELNCCKIRAKQAKTINLSPHHLPVPVLLYNYQSWLVQQTTVYGMKLPSTFQLIGQVGLEEYRRGVQWFEESQLTSRAKAEPITYRCYAR